MEMVSRFRVMRLHCHITLGEVTRTANISHQRLSQLELRSFGYLPQNPERHINALEIVVAQRKEELERAEYICKHNRDIIFNYVKEGDVL